jgi:adenylate cyclase
MKLIIRWARWFGLARAVCIVLLFALVPLRVIDPRPLEEVRLRAFDLFQVLRPREQTARPVVIVDIDEASLKEIGQWPWPRTVVADLVNRLNALGAVVIGFDVVFPEPDRMSPAVAAESFRGLDAETREKLAGLPSNDEVLAQAIKEARVVVGQAGSAIPAPRSQAEMALQTGFAVKGPDPAPFLVKFAGLLRTGAFAGGGDAPPRHPLRRHPGPHRRSRREIGRGARTRSADRPQRPVLGPLQQA